MKGVSSLATNTAKPKQVNNATLTSPKTAPKKSTPKKTKELATADLKVTIDSTESTPKKRTPKTNDTNKETPVALQTTLFPEVEKSVEAEVVADNSKKEKKVITMADVVRYNPELGIGLTLEDVENRMLAGYNNKTKTGSTKSIQFIVAKNVLTFFNAICIGILILQAIHNAPFVNQIFILPMLFNVGIGIYQEIRAKQTIDRLSLLTTPIATVIRASEEMEVKIADLVIDDILLLTSGKQVPADAVVRSGLIEVNESLLTGESDAIIKKAGDKLLSGSYVVSGSCQAQVMAVGNKTYINGLAEKAKKYKKPKSSLLSSIRILMAVIAVIIIPIGISLFLSIRDAGMLTIDETVLKVSGAIIGMIPAGLILLTTIALSVGVIRLGQNRTMVQELYCIEMLARVDTLCLDKTGTITDGTMTVRGILEYSNPTQLTLKQIVPAMINAQQDSNLTIDALIERFGTAKRIRHINLIPFSSSRKYSAVQFEKFGTFVLGAPEYVVKDNYEMISRDVEKQALEGYRVVVVGYSPGSIVDTKITGTVIPLGLIMIEDTIRPDAIKTIQYFKESNVDIKVISGDNPITASRIAGRAGVTDADKFISLEDLTDKEVIRAAEKYSVFGRVSPIQKMVLIQALKNQGRTVAMTGDGVNDILALREADCSISMASGSEAATNVSHLVLLDSNFSSMPKVVSEGRRVINNVQKVATLFITKTLFSLILSIIGIFQGYYPIETRQLIMIEYLIIAVPAFFLSIESNNAQFKGNFLWNVIKQSIPGALVIAACSLFVYGLRTYDPAMMFDDYTVTTIIVVTATFTCLGVLFNVCKPFNFTRKVIFGFSLIACIAATLLLPNLFNFRPLFMVPNYSGPASDPLQTSEKLLMAVLVLISYPLMYLIQKLPTWIKGVINWILKKIGNAK